MHDGEDSVPALDDCFLDEDVKKFLEEHFDRSDWTADFVQNYPKFSNKICAGEHHISWALNLDL